MMAKALAPFGFVPALTYPTGPTRLSVRDIPGSEPSFAAANNDDDDDEDAWAWFRRDDTGPTYRGLDAGMHAVAAALRTDGPFDGIMGFSQGAAVAAMVAAVLDGTPRDENVACADWARAVREANSMAPLRFAVLYGGFRADPADLAWLYEPRVAVPTMHVLGSLDTVVDEHRSRALVEACVNPVVVVHPGGHHVPISKEWVMPVVGFVKKCMEEPIKAKA